LTDEFIPTGDRTSAPYALQANSYFALGWFPIPVKGKGSVPKGVTGNTGTVDADKVRKFLISRDAGYDNLAVRHDGTIAIDVDHGYGGKNGADTLTRFAETHNLSPLPPTFSSTARGKDSPSRQYFYRLPDYVKLESKLRMSDGKLAEDVEICQYHQRYSVVYPSVHPDTQSVYMWYEPGDAPGFSWGPETSDIPDIDDLPELPQEWIDALSRDLDAELDYDAHVTDADDLMRNFRAGEPSPPVRSALERARAQHPGHDETYKALMNAFMYGREGHPGVPLLIQTLISRHERYLETEHPDRAAKGEVASIISDTATKAQQLPVTSTYRPMSMITPLGPAGINTVETLAVDQPVYSEEQSPFILPPEVWDFSGELSRIRQAALSRQVSPDVVLHSCLATIASLLPYESRLDTGKGPTVLSYYAVAVGNSGGGKTEALSCADDLLAKWRYSRMTALGEDGYMRAELGSGEGMVEAYMGETVLEIPEKADDGTPLTNDDGEPIVKRKKVRQQVRHNAMFSSDEGRQMLAIANRSGSTIMSTLCSMWSGTATGASNAKAENSRTVARGSYVLGLLLGFQPKTMDDLFGDVAGGAPQRFAYANTAHPDITADEIDFPDGLSPQVPMMAPIMMELSAKHRRLVREHMAARAKNEIEVGPLDGHRVLLHCRTAALLAILHSKQEVTDDLWDLAETLVSVSCTFRDHLSQRAATEAKEQARLRSEAQIQTTVAASQMVAQRTKVDEAADKIIDKLGDVPYLKRSVAKNALTASLRKYFDEAVEYAVLMGWVVDKDIDNPNAGPKKLRVLALPGNLDTQEEDEEGSPLRPL
jgi:hypothetical protein